MLDQLRALGWDVSFNQEALDEVRALANQDNDGDIGKIHKPRAVSAINERVADDVAAIQERGALPLTLGGDHSLVSIDSWWDSVQRPSKQTGCGARLLPASDDPLLGCSSVLRFSMTRRVPPLLGVANPRAWAPWPARSGASPKRR